MDDQCLLERMSRTCWTAVQDIIHPLPKIRVHEFMPREYSSKGQLFFFCPGCGGAHDPLPTLYSILLILILTFLNETLMNIRFVSSNPLRQAEIHWRTKGMDDKPWYAQQLFYRASFPFKTFGGLRGIIGYTKFLFLLWDLHQNLNWPHPHPFVCRSR